MRLSAVAPIVVVMTAGLVFASAPSKLEFAVSEKALTATTVNCPKAAYDKEFGLYTVIRTQPVDDGCLFFIEGGLIDSIGLGYFPDVAPPVDEPLPGRDITFQPFDGDWYLFVQGF